MAMINQFKGEYEWLSNFWGVVIMYDSIVYISVEHFYQAMKFLDRDLRELIAAQMYPGQAKRLARKMKDKVRPEWNQISLVVMEYGLRCKFNYNYLADNLKLTHPHDLVEGNYWCDNFYGDCYCKKCTHIEGQNLLGKLLMKLRQELIDKEAQLTIHNWNF